MGIVQVLHVQKRSCQGRYIFSVTFFVCLFDYIIDLKCKTTVPLSPFLTGRMFAEHTSDSSTNYDSFLN